MERADGPLRGGSNRHGSRCGAKGPKLHTRNPHMHEAKPTPPHILTAAGVLRVGCGSGGMFSPQSLDPAIIVILVKPRKNCFLLRLFRSWRRWRARWLVRYPSWIKVEYI